MEAQLKEDCPHVESPNFISLEEFSKMDFTSVKCENCEEKEDLWICLFCGKAFCSRNKNAHFAEHNTTNPEHCICLGIKDLNIICYDCKDINNKEDSANADNKGCLIKSEKTDKYKKIYNDYKNPKENEQKEEKKTKKNVTYDEAYQDEIKDKTKKGLCPHVEDVTEEEWEKSPFINGVKDFIKINKDMVYPLLCFSCTDKIYNYDGLNYHHTNNKHHIFMDLNELFIVCMECNCKFNMNLIKDKLTLEQKASIGIVIQRFPITPKFLTSEEIFEIKYKRFIKEFIKGKYKKIIFMVGAGISTSAGIPDFRSDTGLFKQLQEKYNLSGPEEFFYKSTFIENPKFFYEFTKLFDLSQKKPTISHKFMNFLVSKNIVKYVFTQNIDGLEIKAKIPPNKLIFAHGNFLSGHCAKCYKEIDIKKIEDGIQKGEVYYCPDCSGPCKPKIVFYGENLPKRFYECLDNIDDVDLVIIMGTSLKVYPFAAIPDSVNENASILVFNMEKVGMFSYNLIKENELFIKGKTDENVLKFLEDVMMYDEFEIFIKEQYNEELDDIIGKDEKLMNVKELSDKQKGKKMVDELSEKIGKLNLDKKVMEFVRGDSDDSKEEDEESPDEKEEYKIKPEEEVDDDFI